MALVKMSSNRIVYLTICFFLVLATMAPTSQSVEPECFGWPWCRKTPPRPPPKEKRKAPTLQSAEPECFGWWCPKRPSPPPEEKHKAPILQSVEPECFGWGCKDTPPSPPKKKPNCFAPYSVEHCDKPNCRFICNHHGFYDGGYCRQGYYPECCCYS